MANAQRIAPCLWFDDQAEAAVAFYLSVFENSRVVRTTHYTEAGREQHGRPPGSVMTIEFELNGQSFIALNGGAIFHFNEAVSFTVNCETQAEVDYYWEKLSAGGDPAAQQCGWLKDQYGLSWQVVPSALMRMLTDSDRAKVERLMAAVMTMKKPDIAQLERVHAG